VTCDEAQAQFEDLLHERLSEEESRLLRQHLNECPQCLEAFDTAGLIASLIRQRATYHRAPEYLREAIMQEMHRQARLTAWLRSVLHTVWTTPPALCAVTAIVVLALALPLYHRWVIPTTPAASMVLGEAARDYIRLLLNYPPHGTDPKDPEQIRTWFQEALGFAPPLQFWGNQDFQLLRGYPTYIMERRAACLIFKSGDVISILYVFPASDLAIPAENRRKIEGYAPYLAAIHERRVLLWKQQDLAYLIVTRLNEPQLDQLFLSIRKP
jgi:anti-sigma factor (TIGR02949 family)